jgi:peptidoglycan/xylan/chitin deacetylase (PgdA/CDA1 family)
MPRAVILMYHNIGLPPKGARIPNLYVTPRMFRFQMWYLKRAGFTVVSIGDLLALVSEGRFSANLAALTFDDGYADFYENAYPVLRRLGYPSTVYVVSGFAAKSNAWDAESEQFRKPLMDWDQLNEIRRNGVEIGSHTVSHPQLTTLSGDELRDELAGSRSELEKKLGRPVIHFCYPYGDYNDAVVEEVRKAGYQSAVVTRRGHVARGFDPFALRRIPVKLITNPVSFLYKIHTNSEIRKGRR